MENGERKTERAGAKRQTFHGHGTRVNARRMGRSASGVSRRPSRPIGPICPTATPLHVADVPAGAGKLESLEAWKLGFPQCAPPVALKGVPASPESPVGRTYWHVADVPGVQGQLEAWKFRGLEAWLDRAGLRPTPRQLHPSRACRAFCSLFSVFCSLGRVAPLVLRAIARP